MKYMRYATIIIGIILLLSSCFNGKIEEEYTTETMLSTGIDDEYTIETMFSEELRRDTTVEVSDKVLFDQLIITDDTAEMLAERISDYLVNDTHPFEDFDDIKKISDVTGFIAMPFYNEKIPKIKNINPALDSLDDEAISQRYNEMNTERQMRNKYYIDDLYIEIAELFGNENPALFEIGESINAENLSLYVDYKFGIIYDYGDCPRFSGIPQVISYEKTNDGYECEAKVMPHLSEVTIENYREIEDTLPTFRYKFKYVDVGLILVYKKTIE